MASQESTVPVTVPRSVSRSRRWRCVQLDTRLCLRSNHSRCARSHNTPATCASSAERTPSSAPLLVSGTASPAARPPPEEPTPSRKTPYTLSHPRIVVRGILVGDQGRIRILLTQLVAGLPLPPPPGQRSVVSVRLLRFKGTLGTGMKEFRACFSASAAINPI